MKNYRTSDIARIVGVHHNTVRLYEQLGLIPKAIRKENGYRVFHDIHIDMFKLARTAFQIEVLQNGLRKMIIDMVKTAAAGDMDKAITITKAYIEKVKEEQNNAEEAIEIVRKLLFGEKKEFDNVIMKRNEVSKELNISMDTLRNWEMNGLITVKRKENGYRIYTSEDINRLKVIRSLRCANYSLEAILRMLLAINLNPNANIKEVLNTPRESEDIITVCDKLINSLVEAENNGYAMIEQLNDMKSKYF